MRTINPATITEVVAKLCIDANLYADDFVKSGIAKSVESGKSAINALDSMLQNIAVSAEEKMPMCQDTGMVVVYVEIGQEVYVEGNLADAINEGVRRGYRDGYFRASVIKSPLDRVNTDDNTPAVIHYNIIAGDGFKITVVPKGFGSENKSALVMLPPSAGLKGVEDFVLATVKKAGPDACPPLIVGIGLGGTMEKAAMMSKEALLLFGETAEDEQIRNLEADLLEKINLLGIGPAGLKGQTTALGVKILTYPTHIAGMPVAVNLCCHVLRHKSAYL